MSGDSDLVVLLAGCSLATSPGNKDNWIERSGAGGHGGKLPEYICRIAKAVMKSGKTKEAAIAIAVSRTKTWAAGGGGVNADTRAKAAKAVAQWESMKVKNKSNKLVKASRTDGETYLVLSNTGDFSLTLVQDSWQAQQQRARQELRAEFDQRFGPSLSEVSITDLIPYGYIREVWSNFLIVQYDVYGETPEIYRIPFTITGTEVEFEAPVEVKSVWVDEDEPLTEDEDAQLVDLKLE